MRTNRSALSQQATTRQQWTDAKAWQTQDINNTNDPQKKYHLGTVSKNILLEGLNRFHGANLTLSLDVDHIQIVWEAANAIHQALSRNSCNCQEDR